MMVTITLLKIFTDFWLGQWINDGNGNSVRQNKTLNKTIKLYL